MRELTLASLRIQKAGTEGSIADNIRTNLARGCQEFVPAFCFHDGHFVIAGSGHSLPQYLDELKQERVEGRPICAVKGAHDFLIENGIEPDVFVSCEPRDRPLKYTSARTVYLLASRCAPSLFDQLKDHKVIIWHSLSGAQAATPKPGSNTITWDELKLEDECQIWKGRIGIGGGTTSGLRAINLGYCLGFKNIILYGFDSCLAPDKDTKRFTGEKVGDAWKGDVIVDGKRFWCNGAWAQQATEFQELYKGMDIHVEAKGEGLIAAILEARRKRGFKA